MRRPSPARPDGVIGLDTNVVVRFLVGDDPAQAAAARTIFADLTEAEPGFIGREVLLELVWVLQRAYRIDRQAICDALEGLLDAPEVAIEAPEDAGWAITRFRAGLGDFADLMIVAAARRAGCAELATFDRKAGRIAGVRLVDADLE